MDWEEFESIVNEMKKKRPKWFELDSDPPCTKSDLTEIEKDLSVQLPSEYKIFLQNIGGGYFAFVSVFSGAKDSEWYVTTQNEQAGTLKKHSFLAVSDNEVGDYYGFIVENGVCESRVSFFDHEDSKVKKTEYENFFNYLVEVGLSLR